MTIKNYLVFQLFKSL